MSESHGERPSGGGKGKPLDKEERIARLDGKTEGDE